MPSYRLGTDIKDMSIRLRMANVNVHFTGTGPERGAPESTILDFAQAVALCWRRPDGNASAAGAIDYCAALETNFSSTGSAESPDGFCSIWATTSLEANINPLRYKWQAPAKSFCRCSISPRSW